MDGKFLGKISNIYIGKEDSRFGIFITLSGEYTTQTSYTAWDPEDIIPDEHHKWGENDRDKELSKIMRKLSKIMSDAKVTKFNNLLNIPIEMEFENNMLKDWRILTEVL